MRKVSFKLTKRIKACVVVSFLWVGACLFAIGFNTLDWLINTFAHWEPIPLGYEWWMNTWYKLAWWDAYLWFGIIPFGVGATILSLVAAYVVKLITDKREEVSV